MKTYTLSRRQLRPDGIFSDLTDDSGQLIAYALEHAYENADGTWAPKIPSGTFTCQLGPHRLHGMTQDFQTYEITGVSGHSNLLFHWGNWNADSEGCILLGEAIAHSAQGQMVTNSRATFSSFIAGLGGDETFTLVVD